MNKNIEQLLKVIAAANDHFIEKYQQVSTTVGILDKRLQDSNAITVDNIKLGQKLMFIVLDANPNIVGIGTGKAGTEDFVFIDQHTVDLLSIDLVVKLMEEHLLNN